MRDKPTVALLDFQRADVDFGGDFAGSRELQFAASDLRARGFDVLLRREIVGVLGDRWNDDARDRLQSRLAGVEVVVCKVHVDDDLIARLRAAGTRTLFLAAHLIEPPPDVYDAVVDASARWLVVEAIEAWAGGNEPAAAPPIEGPAEDPFADTARFAPATQFEDADGTIRPYARFTLITNRGCPYAADPADSPAFAGVDLSGPLRRLGCSFCEMGGDYRRLATPDYLGFLAHQIRWFASRAPGAEVLLGDEAGAEILLPLLDRLVLDGVPPARILVKARAAGLLARADRFRHSLARARDAGHAVVLFLVGLENFSEAELERFNKGITSSDLEACLRLLSELEEAFPETFSIRRYTGHGFVLWTPWTTLGDLATNIAAFTRHDLKSLSSKAPFSRLRLHSWAPLSRLAARDGLLDPDGLWPTRLRQHLGYASDELSWRFADPGAALAYELLSAAIEEQGASGAFEWLPAALERVREVGPLEADPTALRRLIEREAPAFANAAPSRGLPSGAALTEALRRLTQQDRGGPYRFDRAELAEDGPILRFRVSGRPVILVLEGRRARALDPRDVPFATALTDALTE